MGNWLEVAEVIASGKTREEVEEHYHTFYLETPDFVPVGMGGDRWKLC